MSTGKLKEKFQHIDRLREDNFHLMADRPEYSTIILGQEEAWWNNKFKDPERGADLINDYVNSSRAREELPDIKMVVCGYHYPTIYSQGDYTDFTKPGFGIPWAERVQWYTYWFGYEVCLDFRYDDVTMPPAQPQKLISCFMNHGHKAHRMSLMHSLVNNGMLDKGIFRFCNSDGAWQKFVERVNIERDVGGPYIQLLNKILPNLNQLFSQHKWGIANQIGTGFDPNYHLGCIDIVGSSNIYTPTFCEKTARPLLFGKPFFLVGPPRTNTMLKDLGFELYDEIFDYSMDNLVKYESSRQQLQDYYDKMLEPVYGLEDTPECIEHIMNITSEKVLHNQKRIVDIIFDDSFIPYVFPDHIDDISYNMGVQYPRKILANSDYFSKYLSKEQIRLYSGK